MRAIKALPALLALSLLSAPAFARPEGRPAKPPAAAQKKAPAKPAAKAKANKWEARVLEALKSEGIDEARAKRVVEAIKKTRAAGKPVHEEMRTHRQALKQLVESSSTDESAYSKAIEGLKAGRKKLAELREQQVTELQKILKPSEQARVLKLIVKHRRAKKAKNA